jgi:hypothetical protein
MHIKKSPRALHEAPLFEREFPASISLEPKKAPTSLEAPGGVGKKEKRPLLGQ